MKKIILSALVLFSLVANAQDQEKHQKEKTPAAKGVVYGQVAETENAVNTDEIGKKLVDNKYDGQVKGKVVEVCKAEGCWIRLERSSGESMMVRAKNHAFLMPENIVGKTVVVEGNAVVKVETEEMRKHYAEDAGKSKKEIAKIKGDKKDIQFSATGVKVLD
jgi:hypothetical protein